MTAVNIISGIVLVIASVAIILVVLFTDTDNAGINSALGGGSNSFYGKNSRNTREAKLDRITKVVVAVFFVVAIVCSVLARFFGGAA